MKWYWLVLIYAVVAVVAYVAVYYAFFAPAAATGTSCTPSVYRSCP